MRRVRKAARVLILDSRDRVLLFRFHYREGPLAGMDFWAVPGGGVEEGESWERAAVRELREETGMDVPTLGEWRAESSYPFRLSTGEWVSAHDRYFVLRADDTMSLSESGRTEEEKENLVEWRWWSPDELAHSEKRLIPDDIGRIVETALARP